MTPEEAKELPWPLAVLVQDETPAERREDSEEYGEAIFDALMAQAHYSALKKLREAGRTGQVQRLKLLVYNTKEEA